MKQRDIAVGCSLAVLATINWLAYKSLIPIGFFADDAAYILGAKSLLHGAYRALYVPGEPIQLDYHPGLPFLLTFFVPWVQDQWDRLLVVNAALLGASAILLWRLSRSWISERAAAAIAVLFLIHDSVARLSGQLFPEPLFICLTLLVFVVWKRQIEKPTTTGWILLGLTASWAAFTRPEGSLILIAVFAGIVYKRRWRALIWTTGLPMLLYAAWMIRNMQSSQTPDFLVFLQNLTYLGKHPDVFLRNVDLLLRMQLAGVLLGFPSWPMTLVGRAFGYLLMFGASLAILSGFYRLAQKNEREQEIILAIFVFLMIRFVLFTWRTALDMRYLIVILPFLLLFGAAGAEYIFKKRFPAVLLLIGLAMMASYSFSRMKEWRHLVRENWEGRAQLPFETVAWIREHTLPEDRFLGPAPFLQLYAGRTGFTGIYAPDAETFHAHLIEFAVRYIWLGRGPINVVSTVGPGRLDHTRIVQNTIAWTSEDPRRYRRIYRNEKEQIEVYAVRSGGK